MVADMVADMEVHMVANTEADMVADMVANDVVYMIYLTFGNEILFEKNSFCNVKLWNEICCWGLMKLLQNPKIILHVVLIEKEMLKEKKQGFAL